MTSLGATQSESPIWFSQLSWEARFSDQSHRCCRLPHQGSSWSDTLSPLSFQESRSIYFSRCPFVRLSSVAAIQLIGRLWLGRNCLIGPRARRNAYECSCSSWCQQSAPTSPAHLSLIDSPSSWGRFWPRKDCHLAVALSATVHCPVGHPVGISPHFLICVGHSPWLCLCGAYLQVAKWIWPSCTTETSCRRGTFDCRLHKSLC